MDSAARNEFCTIKLLLYYFDNEYLSIKIALLYQLHCISEAG